MELTSQNPLKFTFVPIGQTYNGTDGTVQGVGTLLFDESKQIIKVRGVEYGYDATVSATKAAQLTAALDALEDAGLVTKSGDTYTVYTLPADIDDYNGTQGIQSSIQNLLGQVKDLIDSLDDQINAGTTGIDARLTAVETAASNNATAIGNVAAQAAQAQSTANSKINSVTGETGTSALIAASTDANNDVTLSATQKLQNAIADAETAVQTVITNGVTYTKNNGTAQGTIDGTVILVGNSAASGEDASAYANSTISAAINTLKNAIDVIQGDPDSGSLTDLLDTITQIKNELEADDTDDESDLNTIIDALRRLKLQTTTYLGINANGSAGSSNAPVALQTSLGNLATYAAAQATAAKNYADGLASNYDAAGAASTVKSEVIGTAQDTSSANTIYGAKAAANQALAAANSAASHHSSVQGATGTASQSQYIIVETTAATENAGAIYTIKTTEALDIAISNAANGIITWDVIGA